jgi:hypothetical protein
MIPARYKSGEWASDKGKRKVVWIQPDGLGNSLSPHGEWQSTRRVFLVSSSFCIFKHPLLYGCSGVFENMNKNELLGV